MAAGIKCTCAPKFHGEITWSGATPSGTCTPVPCDHLVGTTGAGPDCGCLPQFKGEITWEDGRTPKGECRIEAITLFKSSDTFKFRTESGVQKNMKCCVSSQGKPTELVDLNADTLPSAGAVRMFGDKHGCGYMFGDSYHGASRGTTCEVAVARYMEVTDQSLEQVIDNRKAWFGNI